MPKFAYSEALKAAQIVWTPDKMDAYVRNPKELVPGGGKMKYDGLANAAERAAIEGEAAKTALTASPPTLVWPRM